MRMQTVSVVLESSTTSEISLIPHVAFIVYEVARESESSGVSTGCFPTGRTIAYGVLVPSPAADRVLG